MRHAASEEATVAGKRLHGDPTVSKITAMMVDDVEDAASSPR